MNKEYGKLTKEQFKAAISALEKVKSQRQEFSGLMAKVSESRIKEVFTGGYGWADCYELSFVEHIALAVVAFNYSCGLPF